MNNTVREIRELLDMSQAEFAEACGFSRPEVTRLETGEQTLTLKQAQKIARAIGAGGELVLTLPGGDRFVLAQWRGGKR